MKTSGWQVSLAGAGPGARHMALDEALAREARLTVRLFWWEPASLSLGRRQPRPAWLEDRAPGLDVVRRPTGGGIALHGSDVSLALVIPHGLSPSVRPVMTAACRSAVRLLASYGVGASELVDVGGRGRITYCLTQPSDYAVMVGPRKIAGFALRRYPASWLIQGSLLVRPLPAALEAVLPADAREAFVDRAIALEAAAGQRLDERRVAERWAAHWTAWWGEEQRLASRMVSDTFGPKSV